MDQKAKVISAIEKLSSRLLEVDQAETRLADAHRGADLAREDLMRVLHAVYGERAAGGVWFRGRRYSVVQVDGGVPELQVENVDCEVLG